MWRIRSDKYINGILNTRILDNDLQWFLTLDGCNCWAAVAGWGEAQCCHLWTVSPVSSSQSQPGTRAVDTRGAAVAISGYRWLQVATGGCRWLQVATGGCKGWYQCLQWSWWPSPAFSWPRWCPPPGPRTSRFSATSASTGSTQMGSGMDFFYTFYLDLLLGAKHKVLIFLYEDKMSCQSYHSRNLNIFGCGWGELLKVASCNILQGKWKQDLICRKITIYTLDSGSNYYRSTQSS